MSEKPDENSKRLTNELVSCGFDLTTGDIQRAYYRYEVGLENYRNPEMQEEAIVTMIKLRRKQTAECVFEEKWSSVIQFMHHEFNYFFDQWKEVKIGQKAVEIVFAQEGIDEMFDQNIRENEVEFRNQLAKRNENWLSFAKEKGIEGIHQTWKELFDFLKMIQGRVSSDDEAYEFIKEFFPDLTEEIGNYIAFVRKKSWHLIAESLMLQKRFAERMREEREKAD